MRRTEDGYRTALSVAGLPLAAGIDAQGPWSLGPDGVVQRLRAGEATSERFAHWPHVRSYLRALDARRDSLRCDLESGALSQVRRGAPRAR